MKNTIKTTEKVADLLKQYHNQEITLDQLEQHILQLNPYSADNICYGFFQQEIQDRFKAIRENPEENQHQLSLRSSGSLIEFFHDDEDFEELGDLSVRRRSS